ncbi:MAG: lipoate--protein ligase family protein [Candidatus Sericytochromatia bacterium]|nr:lipoate--protein ligase family protein [Candidatus Sericytochromatia bacterium]
MPDLPRAWRLVWTPPAAGAWNMALDEALLEAHRQGLSPPTLRLYGWAKPTISLGYAQRLTPAELGAWRAAGAAVVRRPTGGRAVVHAGDLTYSIVTTGLPPGVMASYRVLSEALAAGLARLGVAPCLAPGSAPPGRSVACFASTTPADLGVGGLKLVGSAQVRRHGAVLQHGCLYLRRTPWLSLLPHQEGVGTLEDALGRLPAAEEVGEALATGFAEALGLALKPGEISAWEATQAGANEARWQLPPACVDRPEGPARAMPGAGL